jgi:hypothetical protein
MKEHIFVFAMKLTSYLAVHDDEKLVTVAAFGDKDDGRFTQNASVLVGIITIITTTIKTDAEQHAADVREKQDDSFIVFFYSSVMPFYYNVQWENVILHLDKFVFVLLYWVMMCSRPFRVRKQYIKNAKAVVMLRGMNFRFPP